LIGGHDVDLFETYLADVLMIHMTSIGRWRC
jgi:hypothetical protein